MRADRLVAILLLLQRREQVTAMEVARELEVSERTARRDLEALGMAGLPITSLQGRNGGWRLVGGGRTDLSGLTASEVRALFLVTGTSSSATPEVRAALRKLVRALPEPLRDGAEAATNAVVVDPAGWGETPITRSPPEFLERAQQAVVEGRRALLGYLSREQASTTRVIDPLGLAAKGSSWYLVAGTDAGLRTFRVDRITSWALTGEPVRRPDGFDLAEAWKLIAADIDEKRTPVHARLLAAPEAVPSCRYQFGHRVRIGPPSADGRVEVEVRGQHVRGLAGEVAMLGGRVEVIEPDDVRAELARLGAELSALYCAVS